MSLSSDFISGFCGETDDDHQQTLSLIREVGFNVGFLFAYSMRKVTSCWTAAVSYFAVFTLPSRSLSEDARLPSAAGRRGAAGEAAPARGVHQCFQRGSRESERRWRWQHAAGAGGGSEYFTDRMKKAETFYVSDQGETRSSWSSIFDSPPCLTPLDIFHFFVSKIQIFVAFYMYFRKWRLTKMYVTLLILFVKTGLF